MRKMFSEAQIRRMAGGEINVKDLASKLKGSEAVVVDENKSGTAVEISLDSTVVNKINNSLQLPESAPAAQQLVGINTSGEQNALGIGDGLEIEDGNIKVPAYEIDFKNKNNISNSDWLASEIYAVLLENQSDISKLPKQVFVKNHPTAKMNGLYTIVGYSHNSSTQLYTSLQYVKIDVTGGSGLNVGPLKQTKKTIFSFYLISNGFAANSPTISTNDYINSLTYTSATIPAGSTSGTINNWSSVDRNYILLGTASSSGSEQAYLHIKYRASINGVFSIVYKGQDSTNSYTAIVAEQGGAYTLTSTTL